MSRIRLPLAAFALFLLAACHSAPTAPVDPQTPTAQALLNGDSAVAGRGGTGIGSGN